MENEGPRGKEMMERMRQYHRQWGASLRGLRRLFLFVHDGGAREHFYENPPFAINTFSIYGTEDQVKEFHRRRMPAVREAFRAVEGQLRGAGITLLTWYEWRGERGRPELTLDLNLGEPNEGAFFSASLRLEQDVRMVRDPEVVARIKTFEVGPVRRKYKYDGVTYVLDGLFDHFLHYYRVANDMDDERDWPG